MAYTKGDNQEKSPESTYIPIKQNEDGSSTLPPAPKLAEIETKSEKFKRLAEFRTKRVMKNIRSLAKLSNRAVYEFTQEELDAIYNAIVKEIEVAVVKFKNEKPGEPEFKL